ncbi:MAG: hypothetical protein A3D24_04275 [Candidatus Blackburnbacteria bacterium RIFCSPHIGHO2_02_FULL_39_13]|uniref:NAD-dependent epimerase/dehydratase domain-containing protein n=1 Tax=Candidatus Blackburnbacteria bacterium RIFCSPLOWO2_01_FULL_40_20 TaxID=1797519 RepID=A0A1G1VAF1_9BACT|nr:MAG: hypothetical protein UT38_C0002G0036 [Microgenomates group bacterium GW2011_GWA2_39_19]OGY07393.1 MAG: hypothetical protein A2694_02050 [Candidatus Blackburnbacteria bacterium RIFCSPHIGHO2_01_FULL_40_17]OGY09873.1 MAG: hypothetical protein A3D24_04275 [Candidatus Blackburnbacteria bacterium RIFCSPHIGHO2_02_FULL_39_13]OGY12454.1 MAG: hypothetical protein A3A77_00555 [Candidatus Blackburnbacteria bacterium RIFCSPLOWO2_01_FULL_40_20]HBL52314.1 hypothetical protein [Candidatus Blackburnbact
MKRQIAILGSSSHIAKGLINNFLRYRGYNLHLYTRSANKVYYFLGGRGEDYRIHQRYDVLMNYKYNVLINCVGVGTASKLQGDYTKYFTVNEEYDNLAIGYLCKYPNALYISFSSGVVYGKDYTKPANKNTTNKIPVNQIVKENYYSIVKLNSEAKHRSFENLRIVDLRIFSYFSRFIDLTDNYFVCEIINCILNKKTFITNDANITRDYIHPKDLFLIIKKCIEIGNLNTAFDVTSAKSVKKREILDYFSENYGLKYKIVPSVENASPTGQKNIYYSKYNKLAQFGYKPALTSMETIKQESRYILNNRKS